jgi:spermidine/putrescine-binding protein
MTMKKRHIILGLSIVAGATLCILPATQAQAPARRLNVITVPLQTDRSAEEQALTSAAAAPRYNVRTATGQLPNASEGDVLVACAKNEIALGGGGQIGLGGVANAYDHGDRALQSTRNGPGACLACRSHESVGRDANADRLRGLLQGALV